MANGSLPYIRARVKAWESQTVIPFAGGTFMSHIFQDAGSFLKDCGSA
jgi:hypothetical protein